ncbi:hypothetical protein OKE80_10660 [Riemerella anatipestifer]|uniref:Uncharacterized protein n=1 Tax=Riemerella anatipestifer TaxID=34085 RepID=A0AAP3AT67_RIEAN|nr:hypothetical protein [Riemerella anatipestifer]MBT0574199.1 hypothetical protein [Riemerella anatipestifer]MCO7319771.1 hypothetical protein [Riemerella anatipestifer]MCQ4156175.1 hypothetical protein [Riemerella anatipestifer]MCQ4182041.1 hypothetical protein [Riemerella anatipestifer]MCU7569419.1 hypothetical protein [Riemerella anatipestifer]
MKEIICPYYWDCGKISETKELNEYDFNFLQSAVLKKMIFMFIHCPKCSRMFKFDTVKWEAEATHTVAPNIIVEKKKKTTKQLISILDKAKIEIPTAYFDYLTGNNFNSEISIFENEDNFKLYDLNELCEKINIDGKSYLIIRQLKGFVSSLMGIIDETSKSKKEQQFTLTELSNCLTIGYENTRILFIDYRDSNSIWIFHSDNGYDFEKTNKKLNEIIKKSK